MIARRHRVLSQDLPLPVGALLERAMQGRPLGMRCDVVQLCAALGDDQSADLGQGGSSTPSASERSERSKRFEMLEPKWCHTNEEEGGQEVADEDATASASLQATGSTRNLAVVRIIQCGEGGAVTRWADGVCLYVNAGRYRNGPSARYRNRFWREGGTGHVLFSWYPSKGYTVTSTAVKRLLAPAMARLLFCRRAPSQPYRLCGRLQPVAIALPPIRTSLPTTRTSTSIARIS